MKNTNILLTIFIYSALCYAQIDTPKQITNFDFDSRNPVFLQYPENVLWYNDEPELFFEAFYNDTSISICSIKYDVDADSFYQLTHISSGADKNVNFINRNAEGKFINDFHSPVYISYKMLIWETNENGNWDIAFSIDSGKGWTPQDFLLSSEKDELDPTFILDDFWYDNHQPIQILYSSGNSVYLYKKGETEENELLFPGNDSTEYSHPTGAYRDNNLYVVAIETKSDGVPHIVYRSKYYNDTSWSRILPIYDRAPTTSPKFTNPDYGIMLSFQVVFDRKKKILLMNPEDFGTQGTVISLLEDPKIETSDFSAFTYSIVTTQPQNDFYAYFPFTFKYIKDDSTFVRIGNNHFYEPYIDIYTKVQDTKPAIGPVGYVYEGYVSYSIWEDSSNNRINLFGLKRIDNIGSVDDPSEVAKDFILFQNYPNPFNPTTKISWQSSIRSWQTLKVYDVLGKEIKTLVDEERPVGKHEVEFDGTSLPSGIYFYQLKAGNYVKTKKMILMK